MPKPDEKPFAIPKLLVWEAWRQVKANKGAPGVDGQDLVEFEADLRNNLYKIWNRMSSGSNFPPPVRAVEIPKPHGGGTRVLGVPTVTSYREVTQTRLWVRWWSRIRFIRLPVSGLRFCMCVVSRPVACMCAMAAAVGMSRWMRWRQIVVWCRPSGR